MEHVKKAARSTKAFVENHKVGLAFVAGAAFVSFNATRTIKGYDAFLEEKGLKDEYLNR